jgi:hypothetical protein
MDTHVTMADSNDDNADNNKKKRKDPPKPKVQTAFGAYGFTRKKKIKNNNETIVAELPMHSAVKGSTAADRRWQCDGCNACFGTSQGLGHTRILVLLFETN